MSKSSASRQRCIDRLTDLRIRRLTKPGRYADGGNLYLNISKSGSRSFIFLWARAGRQHEMGLGAIRDISLMQAREKALEARSLLALTRRKAAHEAALSRKTLGWCCDQVLSLKRPGWRPLTARAWEFSLALRHNPELRNRFIDQIGTQEMIALLRPLSPIAGPLLRGRLEQVIDWAIAGGLHPGPNPCRWKGHMQLLAPAAPRAVRHFSALPYRELPGFIAQLQLTKNPASAALEFLILTAARSAETRGLHWDEINEAEATWTLPPERTKTKIEHTIPLSNRALEILAAAKIWQQGPLVFPGRSGGPLDPMSLRKLLPRGASLHGCRSSFRDFCGDATDFPRELAELSLGHQTGNEVERAYRRSSHLEKRRQLMTAWSNFCGGKHIEISGV